jgi:type IV secretory pathway TrbL component
MRKDPAMKKIAPTHILTSAALAGAALLLTACGSSDDASADANADTVEMPADEALTPIAEEPVADPNATATDAPDSTAGSEAGAEEAADAAANVAAEASAAAEPPTE